MSAFIVVTLMLFNNFSETTYIIFVGKKPAVQRYKGLTAVVRHRRVPDPLDWYWIIFILLRDCQFSSPGLFVYFISLYFSYFSLCFTVEAHILYRFETFHRAKEGISILPKLCQVSLRVSLCLNLKIWQITKLPNQCHTLEPCLITVQNLARTYKI